MLCTENKRLLWATIMHLNTSFWNEAHTNYDDDVEYSPPVKFPKILFSGFRKELQPNLSQPIRGHVGHLGFSNEPEKHKLGR